MRKRVRSLFPPGQAGSHRSSISIWYHGASPPDIPLTDFISGICIGFGDFLPGPIVHFHVYASALAADVDLGRVDVGRCGA